MVPAVITYSLTYKPVHLVTTLGGLFHFMEAVKHVTEITVAYINKQNATERPAVTGSADAYTLLLEAYNPDTIALQEQFAVLYLNAGNKVLGVYRASTGGITGTICDIRLVLTVALKVAATSMIISHNHPSGTLRPSRADEELTQKLKEAAKLMDLKVLDHLIISPLHGEYLSFADEGLL